MGLPIWREPGSSAADSEQKSKADLTPQHANARSSIRRQNSVRIPSTSRTAALHTRLHRSPPPNPPNRDVPPIPALPHGADFARSYEESRARDYDSLVDLGLVPNRPVSLDSFLPGDGRDAPGAQAPPSPIPDPLPSEYRPRSRRGTVSYQPSAVDELPPLRRMGNRRITDSPLPIVDNADSQSTVPDHLHNPGSSTVRGRSNSPEADHWETLLTTITPDPSLPSAGSSFASSAAASFPRAMRQSELPQAPPPFHLMHVSEQAAQAALQHTHMANLRRPHQPEDDLWRHLLHAPPGHWRRQPPSGGAPPRASLDSEDGTARARRSRGQNSTSLAPPNSVLPSMTASNGRSTDDPYCPTDAVHDEQNPDPLHSQTYSRMLDTARAFHHSYDHLDFSLAEFCESFSRHERSVDEARQVMSHMHEVSQLLNNTHERRVFAQSSGSTPDEHGWRRLFERVLGSAPETGLLSGLPERSSRGELASLSDEELDARLRRAVMGDDETGRNEARDLEELRELRDTVRERTLRRLRSGSVRSISTRRERL